MNNERIYMKTSQKHTHATYIMTSTFRVLDNHGLYFLLNNYSTHNIIIFRELKNIQRHDDFFLNFINDFILNLKKISSVQYVTKLEDVLPNIKGDIVLDKAYLNEEKIIEHVFINEAIKNNSGYTIIESNVAVPVKITSQKEEYSARTIRSKIFKNLYSFIDTVNDSLPISKIEKECIKHCEDFIKNKLSHYHLKNHPEFDYTSNLSVYLKYGIISPIRIWRLLEKTTEKNKEVFIDELIVRRELAYNFVHYNHNYNNFDFITYPWAYQTMKNHQYDLRDYIYTEDDYIHFKTHDIYFNTAMKEMIYFGKMHGYMRMYWCKKIIEWSTTYKEAYEIAIHLNNKYFLDGDTPNGYAGVAWCFGKHDRAWSERDIFGKLRYMNANGLKRKFDIDQYVENIEQEIKKHEAQGIKYYKS